MNDKSKLINSMFEFLQIDKKEFKIFIPNEIFNDFKSCNELNGSEHISFAYTYYYLISWLFRYAKYGLGNVKIDVKFIKQLLGYNATTKTVDFIIKKDGILDQLDYTYSSTDYPIAWTYDNGDIDFDMYSELDSDMKKYLNKGKNYKIKVPVKGLYRSEDSKEDNYMDGTFYDVSNTHLIEFDIFMKCMSEHELGCIGFYLYGYLKSKFQIHSNKYNSSYERLASDCELSESTVKRYVAVLESKGLIGCKEGDCSYDEGFKKDANTYYLVS